MNVATVEADSTIVQEASFDVARGLSGSPAGADTTTYPFHVRYAHNDLVTHGPDHAEGVFTRDVLRDEVRTWGNITVFWQLARVAVSANRKRDELGVHADRVPRLRTMLGHAASAAFRARA